MCAPLLSAEKACHIGCVYICIWHVCTCCVRARCKQVVVDVCAHHFCMSAAAASCALSARLNVGTSAVTSWKADLKAGNGDREGRGTGAPAASVQGSADADVSTGLKDGLVSGEKKHQEEGRDAFDGCCASLITPRIVCGLCINSVEGCEGCTTLD